MQVREDAVRLVREDVRAVFGDAFPGTFGVPQAFDGLVPIVGDGVTVVPWTWRGTHTGDFREVRRTGLPVEFAGTTLLTETDEGVRFHRIVDWLTLYRQLGLMMVCRRPRTEGTEDADDSDVAVVQSTETGQRA
jgi:SnoaL-like polyketide cyclase